eukprot:13276419-Alexandrium_andersonii.AAC.1
MAAGGPQHARPPHSWAPPAHAIFFQSYLGVAARLREQTHQDSLNQYDAAVCVCAAFGVLQSSVEPL